MLKKNFLKLTRKSYRRKLIMFGAAIFMSLALTATGFAAWVLSQDTSVDAGGNGEVGIVSDNELKITDLKYLFDGNDATLAVQEAVRLCGENPGATLDLCGETLHFYGKYVIM